MLFVDGTHQWFGSESSSLILCNDDATGKPLRGAIQKQEDLNAFFGVCFEVFLKHGLPSFIWTAPPVHHHLPRRPPYGPIR